MVRTPNEIFAFMNSNKIGDKISLFWIAWAFVAEKNDNFKLTDQIFQKGLRHLAEPRDILQKRYQQFQRRLARHYINQSENNELDSRMNNDSNNERKALTTMSTSHRQPAPIVPMTTNNVKANLQNKFAIFVDNNPTNDIELLTENTAWKNLGGDDSRRKENAGNIVICLTFVFKCVCFRSVVEMDRCSTAKS